MLNLFDFLRGSQQLTVLAATLALVLGNTGQYIAVKKQLFSLDFEFCCNMPNWSCAWVDRRHCMSLDLYGSVRRR